MIGQLKQRTTNVLRNANIIVSGVLDVPRFMALTEEEVLRSPNSGPATWRDIQEYQTWLLEGDAVDEEEPWHDPVVSDNPWTLDEMKQVLGMVNSMLDDGNASVTVFQNAFIVHLNKEGQFELYDKVKT